MAARLKLTSKVIITPPYGVTVIKPIVILTFTYTIWIMDREICDWKSLTQSCDEKIYFMSEFQQQLNFTNCLMYYQTSRGFLLELHLANMLLCFYTWHLSMLSSKDFHSESLNMSHIIWLIYDLRIFSLALFFISCFL